jgi:hypothetical protein
LDTGLCPSSANRLLGRKPKPSKGPTGQPKKHFTHAEKGKSKVGSIFAQYKPSGQPFFSGMDPDSLALQDQLGPIGGLLFGLDSGSSNPKAFSGLNLNLMDPCPSNLKPSTYAVQPAPVTSEASSMAPQTWTTSDFLLASSFSPFPSPGAVPCPAILKMSSGAVQAAPVISEVSIAIPPPWVMQLCSPPTSPFCPIASFKVGFLPTLFLTIPEIMPEPLPEVGSPSALLQTTLELSPPEGLVPASPGLTENIGGETSISMESTFPGFISVADCNAEPVFHHKQEAHPRLNWGLQFV